MKDASHHLKQVQKKVLQSVKDEPVVEAPARVVSDAPVARKVANNDDLKKKVAKDNQLGRSFSRHQVH